MMFDVLLDLETLFFAFLFGVSFQNSGCKQGLRLPVTVLFRFWTHAFCCFAIWLWVKKGYPKNPIGKRLDMVRPKSVVPKGGIYLTHSHIAHHHALSATNRQARLPSGSTTMGSSTKKRVDLDSSGATLEIFWFSG